MSQSISDEKGQTYMSKIVEAWTAGLDALGDKLDEIEATGKKSASVAAEIADDLADCRDSLELLHNGPDEDWTPKSYLEKIRESLGRIRTVFENATDQSIAGYLQEFDKADELLRDLMGLL